MFQIEDVLTVFERGPAWTWITGKFLPSPLACPRCGAEITGEKARKSFLALRRTFCQSCGRRFSPSEGTPIHWTGWQPEDLVRLLVLHYAGLEGARIGKALKKSPASVRDMLGRIELAEKRVSGGSAGGSSLYPPG